MMMTVDMLQVGDYAKFVGHRIQEHLTREWWKVTKIEGNTAHLINKQGATARVRRTERYQHLRANKWMPGDPQ